MKQRKLFSGILAGALLILFVGVSARAEVGTPIPPAPDRWLTDTAGLLSAQAAAEIDARLQAYEQSGKHQLLVYIGKTTAEVPLEDWAVRAFAAWKVGRQGLDDGLVLFIMAEDRRVRIEVGYGLEGLVPDALAGRIINDVLVPGMQKGDPDNAVGQAVEGLIAAISGTGESGDQQTTEPKAPAKLTWMQKIIIGILILGFLLLLITNPSLAIYLLFSILSGGRGGGGGGGGFSGGGGRSGGGGASGSW
jgi:uncharacterized protein